MLAAAALVALAGFINTGRAQQAQQPAYAYSQQPQRAPLQTRIAVVNIGQVIKNYKKFQAFELELKQQSSVLQREFENKKAQAVSEQKELERQDLAADRREQLERDIKRLQREMQDSYDEAKQRMSKREFDQLVQIYKDIRDAVNAYAVTYNFEMVLQYTDAIGPDAYMPPNFQQKLTNRACMPIYVDPRLDITREVTEMLNNKVASAAPAGAPGTGVPAR
jgi:Skp family chaperone for outer membrane proteins